MTNAEALEDFSEIAAAFRSMYGAMERKESRYHFEFERLVDQYRARIVLAETEAEYRGLFIEFISRFEDPHVSLSAPVVADSAHGYSIPFSVMPVEQTFVVYDVDPSLGDQVKRGDELVSIDGKAAMDLANSWEKYGSVANHKASIHTAAARLTGRSAYLSAGIDPNVPATFHLRGIDGAERDVQIAWKEIPHLVPPQPTVPVPQAGTTTRKNAQMVSTSAMEITRAELNKMGARVPFFMTAEGRAALDGAQEVKPSADSLAKFNLTQTVADGIDYFAVTYNLSGKKALLVRLPDYEPTDEDAALNYLRALIDEFQPQVDALVFDETHNPGGSVSFAGGVASLLSKDAQFKGYVEELHADRKWLASLATEAGTAAAVDPQAGAIIMSWAQQVDDAYSSGKTLSVPLPFMDLQGMSAADAVHWTKPSMMLTDELSVSCADLVPSIVKANGMATLFGETTMAGGGNVEVVLTTTNAQAELRISRGIGMPFDPTGAYPESAVIEDNGVTPDVVYSHTLADFRAGYVGYVKAFNATLANTIAAAAPPAPPSPPTNP